MKRFMMFVLAVAILGATFGWTAPAQAATPEEMIKAADALDDAFVAAFNKADAAALEGMYWKSPDVVSFMPGEMIARGYEGVQSSIAELVKTMPSAKLVLTERHHMPAGDVVISWGLWTMTMPGPDGKPVEMKGRFTDVKAERNGKWVYILDHASCPMPPMEQPAAE